MSPKLIIHNDSKLKEYSKEEIKAKADNIIEKIKNLEKELEKLKNMI